MFNKRAIIFLLMILLAACLMSVAVTTDRFVAPPRVKHVDSTAEQYAKKKAENAKKKAENELKRKANKPVTQPTNKPAKK